MRFSPVLAALLMLAPLAAADAQTPPTPTPPMILTPEPAPTPDQTAPQTPAPPARRRSQQFRLGPQVGIFLPSDAKTRDRFGSSWFSFGVGFGPIDTTNAPSRFEFDFNVMFRSNDGNRVFLAPLGARFIQALTREPGKRNAVPYAGVAADLYLADVKSDQDNVRSGLTTGVGGSVLAGIDFRERSRIEARYQVLSRIKGFDFSGLTLSAGYRF